MHSLDNFGYLACKLTLTVSESVSLGEHYTKSKENQGNKLAQHIESAIYSVVDFFIIQF